MTVTVWDELKVVLLELEDAGALVQYPDPRVDDNRQPPFEIHFQPWATDVAESLHRRFGDAVELVVGSLRYPECRPWRQHAGTPEDIPQMDQMEMTVELGRTRITIRNLLQLGLARPQHGY